MNDLRRIFFAPTIAFARGSKLRREGRAPYLHILRWLSEESDWSLDLRQAVRIRPEHRGSVGQVVEKGYLESMTENLSYLKTSHRFINEAFFVAYFNIQCFLTFLY